MSLYIDIKKRLKGFVLNIKINTQYDVTGLLGASGSGKSMTLRCIAGIETPDEGKIILNDKVFFDSNKGINIPARKRKIGFLFQNYALFPNMTVANNITFALDNKSKKEQDIIVKEKINMMKLQGLENRLPWELSGGQQQRVALARALAIEPEILLLDEPFSALDEHLRSLLTKQLLDTLQNYRGTTLFVTHNMDEAYRLCDGLVVLNKGKVEGKGNKHDVFLNPPTLATARITGCKNFSNATYLNDNTLIATDWNINLNTRNKVNKSIKYVGIRAHYIQEKENDSNTNVFKCWLTTYNESPFKVTLYISICKKSTSTDDYDLQWEISKEQWDDLKNREQPWEICLSPERLLVFN